MRSIDDSQTEAPERIRTAAISLFAAHGFTKTTVRSIASAANVSPGLVIHHFGSKDGLRTACDDFVFDTISTAKAANASHPNTALQMLFADPEMQTNLEYLLKSLLDPSEHGQRYFEHYIDLVGTYLESGFAGYSFRTSEDLKGQSATLAALALAPMMLINRIQTSLGTASVKETMTRLAPHLLDFYLNGAVEHTPEPSPNPKPTDKDRSS